MSTTNTNNNQNQNNTPNNGGFHAFIILYLTINGIATGSVIRTAKHMIENGYDRDTMIIMLLWLLSVVYSTQRIYEINRDHRNRNNKDKTR